MPEVEAFGVTGSDCQPIPASDDEAAAMLRACLALFAKWRLSDHESAVLLAAVPETYELWKAGNAGGLMDADQRGRLVQLLGIHQALSMAFRDPSRAHGWVKLPNAAFGSQTALDVMLGGELADIVRVRRYLEAELVG